MSVLTAGRVTGSEGLTVTIPAMTSGQGQFHTNEFDPAKPNKRLRPYLAIAWDGVKALVDNPQQVNKAQAQWLIPLGHEHIEKLRVKCE